jgi:hypothetical protein
MKNDQFRASTQVCGSDDVTHIPPFSDDGNAAFREHLPDPIAEEAILAQ